jgi:hypothetical protein
MNTAPSDSTSNEPKKGISGTHVAGTCAGLAVGCGLSFVISWVIAFLLSAVLAPLFGNPEGGNTAMGVLLAGLTCVSSLIIGGGISYLVGKLFPIFRKKAE